MLNNVGKRPRRRRYTHNQKILYLSQYKKSPVAYRSSQKMMKLPSKTTLNNVLKTVKLDTGGNPVMKDRLIDARSKMADKRDAVRTLIWDELSLTPHLDYNDENNTVCGFGSWNNNTSTNITNHGLTFLLRELFSNWKIFVAFGLCDEFTGKN